MLLSVEATATSAILLLSSKAEVLRFDSFDRRFLSTLTSFQLMVQLFGKRKTRTKSKKYQQQVSSYLVEFGPEKLFVQYFSERQVCPAVYLSVLLSVRDTQF